MSAALRILHVEGNPRAAESVRDTLVRGGLECEIVWVRDVNEVLPAFAAGGFQVILYDHMAESEERRQRVRAEEAVRLVQGKVLELTATVDGIAHDFNNLLGSIFGYASLARDAVEANAAALDYIGEIQRAGRRAADLVQRLHALGAGEAAYGPAAVDEPAGDGSVIETATHGNGERVLVVDDEDQLARLGEIALRNFGYAADAEADVLAALARVEREPERYQLIVSDQSMPGLSGLKFASRVHALRPELPVLLTSGYSEMLTEDRIRAAGVSEVLRKPYTVAQLVQAVGRNVRREGPGL